MINITKILFGDKRENLPDVDGDLIIIRNDGQMVRRVNGKLMPIPNTGPVTPPSIRATLPANTWKRVNFAGNYALIPDYRIICRNATDPNKEIFYEIRSLTNTGFEIKTQEACQMCMSVAPIYTETTL